MEHSTEKEKYMETDVEPGGFIGFSFSRYERIFELRQVHDVVGSCPSA